MVNCKIRIDKTLILIIIAIVAVVIAVSVFVLQPKELYEIEGTIIDLNTNEVWGSYVVINITSSNPSGLGREGKFTVTHLSEATFDSFRLGQHLKIIRMRDIFDNRWNNFVILG